MLIFILVFRKFVKFILLSKFSFIGNLPEEIFSSLEFYLSAHDNFSHVIYSFLGSY